MMMKKVFLSLCCCFPLALAAQRVVVPANMEWRFQYNDSVFSDKAEKVDLPHDFLIGQHTHQVPVIHEVQEIRFVDLVFLVNRLVVVND